MDSGSPRTFELAVAHDGVTGPGRGVVASFVPAVAGEPAVIALACDPRHDPGQPIQQLAPYVIDWLQAELEDAVTGAVWAVIDNSGGFYRALPDFAQVGASGTAPRVEYRKFSGGTAIDDFYTEIGPAAEASIELLSALVEQPSQEAATPPMTQFLDAVESHGSLPAPGLLFRRVALAAEQGDAHTIAGVIQPDPVISAMLINYANAVRFVAGGKTASVPLAITRLGTIFVKRVVFVAEMMVRYRKGACPDFDYRAFWHNAVATGAAMRALLPEYGVAPARADDAFTTGLVGSIGWLAVAETFPALMTRYLERCRGSDPISKARAQHEVFPCEISRVSERYLQRFEFPEEVFAAVAGRSDVDRQWYDILAHATRVAQALSPFECLAIPTTLPVPEACRAEWANWQGFLTALK